MMAYHAATQECERGFSGAGRQAAYEWVSTVTEKLEIRAEAACILLKCNFSFKRFWKWEAETHSHPITHKEHALGILSIYMSEKRSFRVRITFIGKLLHKETLAWCRAKSGTEMEYPDVVRCLHKTIMNMNVMVIWGVDFCSFRVEWLYSMHL